VRNTGHKCYLADAEALREFGIEPLPFHSYVKEYESDPARYYAKFGIKDHGSVHERFYHHVGETDKEPPFDDVLGFLEHMEKCRVTVFAVSGHPLHKLHSWFAEHKIAQHFKCVYGGSRNKVACLRNACRDVHADPGAVCYVGDWGLDMRAANTAGPIPIGITRGHDSRSALIDSGAWHVVEHLHEFGGLIQ
jgi:phosphoglycolate phosphatase-like HAD superfamily hydrolase